MTNIFVLQKDPTNTEITIADKRDMVNVDIPPLLCTFRSASRIAQEKRNVVRTTPTRSSPTLTITLSTRKKVEIHMKSKTARVCEEIEYIFFREPLTLRNRTKIWSIAITINAISIIKDVLKYRNANSDK